MNNQANKISISSEEDITRLLLANSWSMNVLRAAEALGLPDWWIGAGFLRNFVWDKLSGITPEPSKDMNSYNTSRYPAVSV